MSAGRCLASSAGMLAAEIAQQCGQWHTEHHRLEPATGLRDRIGHEEWPFILRQPLCEVLRHRIVLLLDGGDRNGIRIVLGLHQERRRWGGKYEPANPARAIPREVNGPPR
jgi:hypothetical protein